MGFSIGNLVGAVVGAVAKVATAVVNKLSPVAKGGGLLGGIMSAIVGAAAVVANVCEDGEIDEDEEELLEEALKLLVGALIVAFGSSSSDSESDNIETEKNKLREKNPAPFGYGMGTDFKTLCCAGKDWVQQLGLGAVELFRIGALNKDKELQNARDIAIDEQSIKDIQEYREKVRKTNESKAPDKQGFRDTEFYLDLVTIIDGAAGVMGKASNISKVSKVEEISEAVKGGGKANKYCLGGEEHYESLKDLFGADNVEWTSKTTISSTERNKINSWKFPPKTDELYIKYKDVYNNDLYYNQATGDINWPVNNGALEEVLNEVTVNPSMILDRYGEPSGEFIANATDSYESRALAPHSETANHYYYRPTEEFTMDAGTAAPWFGSNGGATQYIKYHPNGEKYTVQELIDAELLDDITDLVKEGLIKIE